MKQVVFILFCLLMSSKMLWAGDGNHYDYTPKSPEAAAFDRVPDIPVSNYTGTLALSIPIYTITCGDIVLPISLDYQGGAIPVCQEATWVGLNWLLNAGGAVVTRIGGNSIYEEGNAYKEDWDNLVNRLSFQQFRIDGGEFQKMSYKVNGEHPDRCGEYGKNWFLSSVRETGPERNNHGDLAYTLYDDIFPNQTGETPTYHASFLGNSVTFVWDKIKKEFMITGRKQNFRIEGTPTSITITDGHGIKYMFHSIEQASLDGTDVDLGHTPKDLTLYLSSICSPMGHVVNFNYVDGGLIKPLYHVTETLYDNKFPNNAESYKGMMTYEIKSNALIIRRLSHLYTINTKRLKSITTDTGLRVVFNPSASPRLDLNGESYCLDNIEIYQMKNNKETLLKKYRFALSYFSKNLIGGNMIYDLFRDVNRLSQYQSWFQSDDFMYKRLRLDSLWEENVTTKEQSINKYKFNYFDGLPCKASSAIDYWGYFNGRNNMRGTYHSTLPRCFSDRSDDAVYDIPTYMKSELRADRRSDLSYATSGMLCGVSYPTGGSSEIEYEENSFTNAVYFNKDFQSTKIPFGDVRIYLSNQINYSQGAGTKEGDSIFEIKYPGKYVVHTSFYKNNQMKKAYWRNLVSHPVLIYQIEKVSDKYGTREQVTSCQVVQIKGGDTLTNQSIGIEQEVYMKKGKCRLMIAGKMNDIPSNYAFYQVTARMEKAKEPFESKGAGVRVKEITTSDGVGGNTKTLYSYINGERLSSGLLMAPTVFARERLLLYQTAEVQEGSSVSVPEPRRIKYWKVCGDCLSPNPLIVGYGSVVEKKLGNSDKNGEHIYNYWNRRWGSSHDMDFFKRIEDPRNGLLLSDSVFDENHRKVRVVENSYKWNCTDSRLLSAVIENIYFGPNHLVSGVNPYMNALPSGCMQIYLYPSVQFSMLSSHQEVKEFKGKSQLESWKDVWYNQTNGLDSLSRFSQSESDNVVLEETYYPQDFMTKSNAKTLTASNITSVPMERIASVKNEDGTYVVKDSRTDYDASGNIIAEYTLNNGSVMPRNNFTLWKNSPTISSLYDNSATLSYNQSHKPREVRIDGAEVCTYIWGYYGQYPIAVVKGANFSMVASMLDGSSAVDDLESAATPSYSNKQLYALLSKLPGCLVTTYSYNPYVGMVEMIDNKGECTTYDYDSFARLSAIKDHDGIVSTAFKYNYKHY